MQPISGHRPLTLKGRYVFPVAGPPIPDGSVVFAGGRIVTVGWQHGDGEVRDLGNVAILPGMVNAHVHLDFSDLAAPLGQRGIGLADWVRRVIEYRRSTTDAGRPVALGLAESARRGVTTLGEIAQTGWSADQRNASPLSITVFQELIAPTAGRVAGALELARSHLTRFRPHAEREQYISNSRGLTAPGEPADNLANRQLGLSPHAPYSVHPDLLSAVIELSVAQRIPLAMHLAESPEELELLRHGTGPLRTLLEELGAWNTDAFRPGVRPLEYLRLLASAHHALIIHGNYLDDEEIAFLGASAARMAAVYCPRSHDWFAHADYPLEKMLASGVTVALGTDGRGSSPDLSLLAEMRFAARRHPGVALDRILHMATLGGARALGWDDRLGSLEPGKQADLAIVALPERDAADPHELLFASEEPVVACYCRGTPK